ncbi:MAG TPA: zinc metalloprotease HtpX [Candidatus Eisenbacteria bacterium]|jgi:heat shock protein HtpX|nr:zinc metalloprotease HtpX [Candidatus Eisenbacteria bacterium]
MNGFRTTILLAALTALVVWIGQMFGGTNGAVLALVIAGAMNFFSYWFSDKIVLRMYGAQEITQSDDPELFSIVRELTVRDGLPMPRVYIIPEETPNAFATGRNPEHAAVAVTHGIRRILDRRELAGVLGHELSHVKHRDILISSIAATLAGAISYLAQMAQWAAIFGGGSRDREEGGSNIFGLLFMMIVAPIAAMLIQMAVSRSREYSADEGGAKVSGDPLALASALRKLQMGAQNIPLQVSDATANSTAHMFIVNPLSGGGIANLFSTHPPMEERIARLEAMAKDMSYMRR